MKLPKHEKRQKEEAGAEESSARDNDVYPPFESSEFLPARACRETFRKNIMEAKIREDEAIVEEYFPTTVSTTSSSSAAVPAELATLIKLTKRTRSDAEHEEGQERMSAVERKALRVRQRNELAKANR